MKRRVLVIEDEAVVARDATTILADAGFDALPPLFLADDAEAFVALHKPDVVLLDIRLGHGVDGIELGARLRKRFDVPIVFVSAHSDSVTLARAGSLAHHGFVVKPFHPKQLVATVVAALSQADKAKDGAGAAPPPPKVPGVDRLTARESAVLDALLAGRRIAGIAADKGLSAHTVRNQVKSIMSKLGVHSQDQLVQLFERKR
jgi:DNA-binding NarL/FixJ family response regulator